MRIGVTGGAGYIGAHVTIELLALGHEVLVIDNLSTGSRLNLAGANGRTLQFLEGDIRDPESLSGLFDFQPDAIFHFAASKAAGESMLQPERYSDNNIRGTLGLLEAMVRRGCARIIFSSSAAVYGSPTYTPLDEQHPCQPENYYGYTKLCIEENLRWFSRLRGIRFAALRYFNAAGYDLEGRVRGLEINPQNLLPIIMEVATGVRPHVEVYGTDYDTPDGTCIRDYVHVTDLSRAHIMAMECLVRENRDLTVNLGSEQGISVREMVDVARRVTGHPIPHVDSSRRPGDPARMVAGAAQAARLLGWRADLSGAETLVETTWRAYRPQ